MGKAARIKAQRGEKFVRAEKQPTGKFRSAKDRQEERRKDRKVAERSQALIARLANGVAKQREEEEGRG